jgi:hypothetical protein
MTAQQWTEFLDSGLYTVSSAARILAAKPEKVRSWVEGYGNSDAAPILIKHAPQIGGRTVLSFLDLIEAAFVRHFCAIGYSKQTIRKVALKLRNRHGIDIPSRPTSDSRPTGKRFSRKS